MKNEYYLMRHGESVNNAQKIIISDPKNGVPEYGLTEKGRSQVREAAQNSRLGSATLIFSSDFLRAKETAEIVREVLKTDLVNYDERLRERFFGEAERGDDSGYDWIWEVDEKNPEKMSKGIEHLGHLVGRSRSFLNDLEGKYEGQNILLISHGDPLHVLEALIKGTDISTCHNIGLPENGAIKRIINESSVN